jgi:hypothetical protein
MGRIPERIRRLRPVIKAVWDSAEQIARRRSLPERDGANPNRIFGLVSRANT